MSVMLYLLGAVWLMLLGALLADAMVRRRNKQPSSTGFPKMDERCPKCKNKSLFKRHCKVVCEQCGVIRDCADPF